MAAQGNAEESERVTPESFIQRVASDVATELAVGDLGRKVEESYTGTWIVIDEREFHRNMANGAVEVSVPDIVRLTLERVAELARSERVKWFEDMGLSEHVTGPDGKTVVHDRKYTGILLHWDDFADYIEALSRP